MKKVLQKISITSVGVLTPALVFAQGTVSTRGIEELLIAIHRVISLSIPVLISLGVLAFMWGVVLYLFGKNKDEGKSMMLWGIIALFVMTSVWGLVGILRGTLFRTPNDAPQNVNIPQINY